jgi:hypothetical protein
MEAPQGVDMMSEEEITYKLKYIEQGINHIYDMIVFNILINAILIITILVAVIILKLLPPR